MRIRNHRISSYALIVSLLLILGLVWNCQIQGRIDATSGTSPPHVHYANNNSNVIHGIDPVIEGEDDILRLIRDDLVCLDEEEMLSRINSVPQLRNTFHYHIPKSAGTHLFTLMKYIRNNSGPCCHLEEFLKEALSCSKENSVYTYELYDKYLIEPYYRCTDETLFIVPLKPSSGILHSMLDQECKLILKNQIGGRFSPSSELINACASCTFDELINIGYGFFDSYRSLNAILGINLMRSKAIFFSSDLVNRVAVTIFNITENDYKQTPNRSNKNTNRCAKKYKYSSDALQKFQQSSSHFFALNEKLASCQRNNKAYLSTF